MCSRTPTYLKVIHLGDSGVEVITVRIVDDNPMDLNRCDQSRVDGVLPVAVVIEAHLRPADNARGNDTCLFRLPYTVQLLIDTQRQFYGALQATRRGAIPVALRPLMHTSVLQPSMPKLPLNQRHIQLRYDPICDECKRQRLWPPELYGTTQCRQMRATCGLSLGMKTMRVAYTTECLLYYYTLRVSGTCGCPTSDRVKLLQSTAAVSSRCNPGTSQTCK